MRFACINLCSALFVWSGAHAAVVPETEYDAVIRAARNGETATALDRLRAWHAANPADRRIVFDLVAVLDMAGRYEEALAYRAHIMATDAPPYALKSFAHAARLAQQLPLAEMAYGLLLKKTPADAEAQAGLAYTRMAQGRVQEALTQVRAALPSSPDRYRKEHLPLIVALAELHERREEWLQAAAAYQEALRFDPNFRYAIRGRVLALANAGLSFLAWRLAERHPEAFNDAEKFRFAHDANARTIRFGQAQIAADTGPKRFTVTDDALLGNAALAQRTSGQSATDFDRLLALRDRMRMQEVVTLYESLSAKKVVLPIYARLAAADAYLWLQQPETARDIYVAALNDSASLDYTTMLDEQIALVYAYVEAEQHDQARALSDKLLTATPQVMHQHERGLEAPNAEYGRVKLIRALLDVYGDRLEDAEKKLDDLQERAPLNEEIRAAWAGLQSARERPRAALTAFATLRNDNPKSVDAAVGHAELLLTLHQLTQARAEVQALQAAYPEKRSVKNLQEKLKSYDSPFLRVETTAGRGAAIAGADSVYDAALYSAPLDASLGSRYRFFTHLVRASGSDSVTDVTRTRMGVGFDYRDRDFQAEAEVNRTLDGSATGGIGLALSWDLSDRWQARATLDTNVVDLPAAALSNGIQAKSMKLALNWHPHESRYASGELSAMRFSDGNQRHIGQFLWRERLLSNPKIKLDATLGLSASTNSATNAVYFNPSRDSEAALGLRGEWLLWRRYQRSFRHALSAKWGQYWQEGFGNDALADVHYEQEWRQDDVFEVKYGLGRNFHPYDGAREYRSYVYLNLNWHMR
ncbi:MAG: poly-beta-1,6 N-acetyl-D-glucosamine export porin PgaA [Proteobacteria bacterium]|nr:poly-beta-1,6 N-acetyl-D-glucosamine export porin PgaA [Pseudomonadota bacterium]